MTGRESHTGSSDHAPGARGPNKCNGGVTGVEPPPSKVPLPPVPPPLSSGAQKPEPAPIAFQCCPAGQVAAWAGTGVSSSAAPASRAAVKVREVFNVAARRLPCSES